jgi:hypothetical protein
MKSVHEPTSFVSGNHPTLTSKQSHHESEFLQKDCQIYLDQNTLKTLQVRFKTTVAKSCCLGCREFYEIQAASEYVKKPT